MSRRLPNLNQLRAFEAAARHLSFKDAAEELHVTHAAISHQIKALEADLGQQLFHRLTRRVELTAAARDFAARLTPAFAEIRRAAHAIAGQDFSGQLKISMAPYFSNRVILPHLQAFYARFPKLEVVPHISNDLIDLEAEGCDAAVRYGLGDWPGLVSLKLYDDRLSPVAAPSLIANRKLPLSPDEICQMHLGESADLSGQWQAWFSAVEYRLDDAPPITCFPDRARVNDMVFSGSGVALGDLYMFAPDLAAGSLVRLHDTEISAEKATYVVYPDTDHPDPRVVAFADWLKDIFSANSAQV